MKLKLVFVILSIAVITCLTSLTTQAAIYEWNDLGGGDMGIATNWTLSGPAGGLDDRYFRTSVGGSVTGTLNADRLIVGDGWGSSSIDRTGIVNMIGANVTVDNLNVGHDDAHDGDSTIGNLTLSTSTTMQATFGTIGWVSGTTGTLTVNDSALAIDNHIDVGRDGGDGTVNITNSSSLTGGAMYVGNGADYLNGGTAGTYAGIGDLTVDADSSLTLDGWEVPDTGGFVVDRLAIGLRGGTGSARIDGTAGVGDILIAWDNGLGDATGSLAVGVGADIDGNLLDLGDLATLTVDLNSSGVSGDLDVTGALDLDGMLDLDLMAGQSLTGEYILATGTSVSGTFSTVTYEGSTIADPSAWYAISGTHHLEYRSGSIALSPSPISGDANRDGTVDVSDLGILASNYGTASGAVWSDADFDGDGVVDVSDLGILATHYGETLPTASAIPEPCSITLLLCGLTSMAILRRRR